MVKLQRCAVRDYVDSEDYTSLYSSIGNLISRLAVSRYSALWRSNPYNKKPRGSHSSTSVPLAPVVPEINPTTMVGGSVSDTAVWVGREMATLSDSARPTECTIVGMRETAV